MMSIVARYISVSQRELLFYRKESHFLENVVKEVPGSHANELYLGEAWQGITYLLTGQRTKKSSDDLLHIIISNQYIDENQDFGCGPAHYVDTDEAKRLYARIANWDKKRIKKRFKASSLKKLNIYPDARNYMEALDFLYQDFDRIRLFLKDSVEKNNAIIGLMLPDDLVEKKEPVDVKKDPLYVNFSSLLKPSFYLHSSYRRAIGTLASFAFILSRIG